MSKIHGIGTDIVTIARLAGALERHGEAFAEKILAMAEWADYLASKDKPRFLAKRFAAKEAFAKACGTGLRTPLALTAIWVEHDHLGKPKVAVTDVIAAWLQAEFGAWCAHLSLSDEKDTVVAFVVLEAEASHSSN